MSKWKPWQLLFLVYLILLNLIVACTLAFFFLKNGFQADRQPAVVAAESEHRLPSPAVAGYRFEETDIDPFSPSNSQSPESTPISTSTVIQPVDIPPIPPPATGQAAATVTGTATPVPTNSPVPTATSTQPPTYTPSPTATFTETATRTPSPTHTPQPTATKTSTPTRTPRPTATPTSSPTATLRPTATPSPTTRPTNTATARAVSTRSAQTTPIAAAAISIRPTPETDPSSAPAHLQSPARLAEPVDAVSLTNDSVALSWPPRKKNSFYRIYSDMGTGYGVYLFKAQTAQPAFIDEGLRPGIDYRYRIMHLEAEQEVVLAQIVAGTFADAQTLHIDRSTQSLTGTGTRPTLVPTALPADAVLLGLQSHNSFTDNFNTLTIVGEARNDSGINIGHTNITVTFYDATGTIIGTASGATVLDVLAPGESSPFTISLTQPSGLASYSLRAVARPVDRHRTGQLAVIAVKRYEDDAGFLHIEGEIENVGTTAAKRTKVIAVIFGRDRRVINVDFSYADPPILAPGDTATFDIIFAHYPRYFSHTVIPFEE